MTKRNITIPTWQFPNSYHETSQRTLTTALEKIAFYRSWQSLDPGANYSLDERFTALPALTKKDIRENFPHNLLPTDCNLAEALAREEISLVDTSGTTEDKITNIWNQQWWDNAENSSWQLNTLMSQITTGEHAEAILVNAKNVGFASDETDLTFEQRRLWRFLFLNEKTDFPKWTPTLMDRMIKELGDFQPVVLEANPTYLAHLANHIATNKRQVFQPQAIVLTYEHPTHLHYKNIRKAFTSPIISSYGTTETGYVFMQCEHGKLHQNIDFCRVDFQPLQNNLGGPLLGRILVTPLNNPWNYFLRFDTGDIVLLEESGRCQCGRNHGIILAATAGRKANLTLTCEGRLVTLLELDQAMSKLTNIDAYQLVQHAANDYVLTLVAPLGDTIKIAAHAKSILHAIYGAAAKITINFEKVILPELSGKYLVAKAMFPIDLENYLA